METEADAIEQRGFLLTAAAWQDSLLQSYRVLHVTIQGFFIASGAALLAIQLTGAVQQQTPAPKDFLFGLIFTFFIGFLFWLQRKTANEMQGVIKGRAADINHWHMEVMLLENSFPTAQRSFTYFKIWQHFQRTEITDSIRDLYLREEGISKENVLVLITKGEGHTRGVLDEALFNRMQRLWVLVLAASFLVTGYFFWQGMWPKAKAIIEAVQNAI